MCGRFTLRSPARDIARAFDLPDVPEMSPRYNIAPTQPVPAVRLHEGNRELVNLHWGLIPFWADDPKIGNRMINARAETVAKKPSFRVAFRKRRCLIVTDGFYEWQKLNGKQPHYIRLKSDEPFGFAGLWEHWESGGEEIESCTIIVTEANELLEPIHDRMPVIVPPDRYELWLDPECQDQDALQEILQPYPSEELTAYPVSKMVNKPQNDDAKCIEPVE